MSASAEIFQLRKAHRIDEALEKARAAFAQEPDDLWIQRAYGWVLFDLLKQETESFESQKAPPAHLAKRFDELLGEYHLFADNIRPDLLHSQILAKVLKGSKVWHRFLAFARWWDPASFRAEDREPYKPPEGREIPSLRIRYTYAVAREALHHGSEVDAQLILWAEDQLDLALREHPNDQWLHYYKSQFLLNRHQTDLALEHLLPVLNRQKDAAWTWSLFGHIQEQQDPAKAIVAYQRAVQLARQPQEVANTRIALARLLAAQQRYEEAAVQVRHALEYRTSFNYRIPPELAGLAGTDWYSRESSRGDLPSEPDVSRQVESILSEFVETLLHYRLGIIDHQNADKALAHVAFGVDDGIVLPYRMFRGIQDVPVAEMVEVGFVEGEHRPHRWRRTELRPIHGFVVQMSGRVDACDGHAFGFMASSAGQRVFVPPDLMAELDQAETTEPQCIAVMSKDRKGKKGWKALRWLGV